MRKNCEIIVTNQEELNRIPLDFSGDIIINSPSSELITISKNYDCFNSFVVKGNSNVSVINKIDIQGYDNCHIELYNNSSAYIHDNCLCYACEDSWVYCYDNCIVFANSKSTIRGHNNCLIMAYNSSRITACDNCLIMAHNSSRITACDNCIINAKDTSFVDMYDKSLLTAKNNVQIDMQGESSAETYDNCIVNMFDESNIIANNNTQIKKDKSHEGNIQLLGNSKMIDIIKDVSEYFKYYGIKHNTKTAILYKAVHKDENGIYRADYDENFIYEIGKYKIEKCDKDINATCSYGINIAPLNLALNWGEGWDDLAILEVETKISDIIMPKNTDGKVRTPEVKVLREISLEECGIKGKMIEIINNNKKNKENPCALRISLL